ncbi:MAG: hypothetical protein AAF600_01410 [Bacteroidota bacterium]
MENKNSCGSIWLGNGLMVQNEGYKVVIVLVFFLSWFAPINAQEEEPVNSNGLPLKSRLTINDFAYPLAPNSSEQHSNFIVSYEGSQNFFLELQGFYDSYLLADVFRIPIRAKLYVSDKFYLFSGVEVESERDKLQIDLPPPQLKYKNGFGYDVKNSLMLEFEHDLHFNKSVHGVYGTPSLFSLKGKYRF